MLISVLAFFFCGCNQSNLSTLLFQFEHANVTKYVDGCSINSNGFLISSLIGNRTKGFKQKPLNKIMNNDQPPTIN